MFGFIATIIGIMVLVGSIYYLVKEKDDEDSKKIYSITTIIGVVITIYGIIKLLG